MLRRYTIIVCFMYATLLPMSVRYCAIKMTTVIVKYLVNGNLSQCSKV